MLTLSSFFILGAIPLNIHQLISSIYTRLALLLFISYISIYTYFNEILSIFSGSITINPINSYIELLLFICAGFILASMNWLKYETGISINEYSVIALFSILGSIILINASDLITLYIGIELQSFAVYILAGVYRYTDAAAAGLKYFILGALASSTILLGITLIYYITGSSNLNFIYEIIVEFSFYEIPLTLFIGFLFIILGLIFKIAAAPLHSWALDVYDGTPTYVTTWLIVIPKISIITFFIILTHNICYIFTLDSTNIFIIIAILSLIIGSLSGIVQTRIKRILTYSTISHVGFIIIPIAAITAITSWIDAQMSILFYLFQYSLTNLCTFIIIIAIGYIIKNSDIHYISEIKGILYSNSSITIALAFSLFSIAGVPPIVGFFAKWSILNNIITNNFILLGIFGVIASVISSWYYLNTIYLIFQTSSDNTSFNISSIFSYNISIISFFILFYIIISNFDLNTVAVLATNFYL